jgi:RHS repeat-associated protein
VKIVYLLISLFIFGNVLLTASRVFAQEQYTKNTADLALRRDVKVDPATLGVSLEIPLGGYNGRAGNSLPITLRYSSKVWRINFSDMRETTPDNFTGYLLEPLYGQNSVSGWTTSLGVPEIENTLISQGERYGGNGKSGDCGNRSILQSSNPCYFIHRMQIRMSDGSSHELRENDSLYSTYQISGMLYSVDGSNLRFDTSTNTLFLPDGSRYVFESVSNIPKQKATHFIDRNGNKLAYNSSTRQWTDTLGRNIDIPLPVEPFRAEDQAGGVPDSPAVGEYTYAMPGLSGTTSNYKMRWSKLANALTDPSQPLQHRGNRKFSYGNAAIPQPNLFVSMSGGPKGPNYVCSSEDLFNPVVLREIELPTGEIYRLSYTIYGEIDKIIYPTGAYERFHYQQVPSLSYMKPVYAQGNRGVVERWISPTGNSNDEEYWQYGLGSVTSPDGTKTINSYHVAPSSQEPSFGFETAKIGKVYETKVQLTDGTLRRRNLFEWGSQGATAGGYSGATRNPFLVKQVEILFEPNNSQALAKTVTYQYDQYLNVISTTEDDFVVLDQTTAQTATIDQVQSGNALRTSEIDYLTDSAYLNQQLVSLPSATRLKDAAGNIVSKSEIKYDEVAYPVLTYSSITTGWLDPGITAKRGLVTTTKTWDNSANNGTGNWLVTHFQYDQFGNPRKTWSPVYEGQPAGNISEVRYEDAYSDQINRYSYALPTKKISVIPDPTGQHGSNQPFEASLVYNFNTGLPISSTDVNNQTTQMQYNDPLLRPTKVIAPNGQQTISQYGIPDSSGQLPTNQRFVKVRTQIDETKWKEGYSWFDGLGRTVKSQSIDSNGDVFVETEYDNMSRPKKTTNPYRTGETIYKTESFYDDLGRVTKIKTPDNAEVLTSYGLATTGGEIGTVVIVTDQALKQRRSITNGLGQLKRVDEPNDAGQLGTIDAPNQPTSYSYDTLNNLTTVSQGVQTRSFVYDSLSRLKSAMNPESGLIQYNYDNNGNLTSKMDARNITTSYVYDNLNRVKTRSYSDTTPAVTYTYDNLTNAKGKLIKVSSSVSTTEYPSFDILGRVLTHKQTTDGQTYNSSYVYNLSGALIEETYPSGRVVKNTLSNDGNLQQVQSKKTNDNFRNYANSFNYTAAGAVSSMRLGNGRWENTSFNSRLQPIQIGLGSSATSQNLLKLNFDYGGSDNNGNVKSQTITVPTSGANQGFVATQNYTYDSLNRLKSAVENINGNQTPSWKQTFTFDRYGNRRFDTANGNTTTLPVNCIVAVCNPTIDPATNKLIGYQFDSSGNTKVDANGQTFIYDAENKQVQVSNSNGIVGQYFYDGDGKRIKKVVPSTGETSIFIYDASGKMVAEYSTQVASQQDAKVSYLTSDHLGSPRINTDANGQVIARHDYQPFGEEIQRANYGADSTRQKFTSYERDNESDLDFAEARYHNYNLGRFNSPDPLYFQLSMAVDPQRFNLYGYARNNPLKWTDPNGERLYLRGDTAWLQRKILYEQAGGQEEFEKYFHIEDGQVLLNEGVDVSNVNSGVQLLLDLVNSSDNNLYYAGTDGAEAAALFQGSVDKNGKVTQVGKNRANEFTGNNDNRQGGTLLGTTGRSGQNQPANLANGDPVFFVLAINTESVQTQVGVSFGPSFSSTVGDGLVLAIASGDLQREGLNQQVRPVSIAIHESAENLEFANQRDAGNSMNYTSAHNLAIEREAVIRRELKITGGFAGGLIQPRVPKRK